MASGWRTKPGCPRNAATLHCSNALFDALFQIVLWCWLGFKSRTWECASQSQLIWVHPVQLAKAYTLYMFRCPLAYMVSCPVLTDPPHGMGGGVGTRIRYTHCISTLCRLSTLPQYYKPPPHHRGGWGILYTTTIPQTTPTPQGGGNPLLPPPLGGEIETWGIAPTQWTC